LSAGVNHFGAALPGNERFVVVEGPADDVYRFALSRDDSVLMYVDGMPLVGVLGDGGAGWWPDGDGQDWQPLTPGTAMTSRRLHVLAMSEAQFHGISHRLHLTSAHLGRFKGAQGKLRAVTWTTGRGPAVTCSTPPWPTSRNRDWPTT
jgi:hypothetical protein